MDAKTALLTVLDAVDYTSGVCKPTEMIAAILPKEVLELAKEAGRSSSPVDVVVSLRDLQKKYLKEADGQLTVWTKYSKKIGTIDPNMRLLQGEITTLYKVVNDLRSMLNEEPLQENWSGGYGFLNEE